MAGDVLELDDVDISAGSSPINVSSKSVKVFSLLQAIKTVFQQVFVVELIVLCVVVELLLYSSLSLLSFYEFCQNYQKLQFNFHGRQKFDVFFICNLVFRIFWPQWKCFFKELCFVFQLKHWCCNVVNHPAERAVKLGADFAPYARSENHYHNFLQVVVDDRGHLQTIRKSV